MHAPELMSQSSHLKLGSVQTNDCNLFLNNQETLQWTRSGSEVRFTSQGGTGEFRYMSKVNINGDLEATGIVGHSTTAESAVITDALQVLVDANTAKTGISSGEPGHEPNPRLRRPELTWG